MQRHHSGTPDEEAVTSLNQHTGQAIQPSSLRYASSGTTFPLRTRN